ncbi:hypothetical protein D9M70_617230 [compost metagenome]
MAGAEVADRPFAGVIALGTGKQRLAHPGLGGIVGVFLFEIALLIVLADQAFLAIQVVDGPAALRQMFADALAQRVIGVLDQ